MYNEHYTLLTIWIYAFVSVVVISILGLIPIVFMPKLQKSKYQNDLLQFLIGLAVGTLTADSLLHLLPSAIGGHSHNQTSLPSLNHTNHSDEHNESHNHTNHDHNHHQKNFNDHDDKDNDYTVIAWIMLVAIIGFLFLERIIIIVTDLLNHQGHSIAQSSPDSSAVQMADSHSHEHQNHHQHQHHHLTNSTRSFMFMIITGDGLHNFFDGIAIGVSYGNSLAIGLSTSIAILCHELPHEIGDFAVLIKSGMTIKRAVLYNTLSSILCLFGASLGVFIGKIDVRHVSALIAGMFLYISLVDMVPQLDCYQSKPIITRIKKFLVQVIGVCTGIVIMALIAIYESKLHSLIEL